MTLKEFQASRRWHASLADALGNRDLGKGFLYAKDLHIEQFPDGRYYVGLDKFDMQSPILETLERKLLKWAKSEGIF